MKIKGWKYYVKAAIPSTPPHIEVDATPVDDGSIWSLDGEPLLARWTSDWDCGYETNWWYCIKDTPFDISSLKSKRRYEINKGNKYFEVRKISPSEHTEELFRVTLEAYKGWPEKYRPKVDKDSFDAQVFDWNDKDVFAGFERESGLLQGYAILADHGTYAEFSVLRTEPDAERNAINAAMVAGILEYYKDRFDGFFYINDGSKAIRHETAFQDYLEKYFEFRKAYCRLNVRYRKDFGLLIKILYPFRHGINPDSKIGNKVSAILNMEEICRSS